MDNERQEGNFLEPRTLLAIVLVGIIFFAWQNYLGRKYPDYYKAKNAPVANTPGVTVPGEEKPQATAGEAAPAAAAAEAKKAETFPAAPEETFRYENDMVSFEVSSHGMTVRNFMLKEYTDRQKDRVRLGGTEGTLFATKLEGMDGNLPYHVRRIDEQTFVGTAKVDKMVVTRTLKVDPQTGKMDNEITVEQPLSRVKGVDVVLMENKHQDARTQSRFMPAIDNQEFMYRQEGKTERVRADSEKEEVKKSVPAVSMAAVGSQFFVTAIADHSEILPTIDMFAPTQGDLALQMHYLPANPGAKMDIKFTAYAGGKSVSRLEAVDSEFSDIVNLGFFSAIGRVLLKILKWAYSMVGNWGWAIIVLTLLVRALVLPFNVASYRSMKKMQSIQPLLQSLRERYKDDPAALNRESMTLMREQKVNPLGGCLPMLLQMPIFFALYKVLGQSIELYQAPFIFWIQDLSLKDPFYILPVLMGIVMFVQQRLTPTGSMDPNQAKILKWMPLLFCFFMLGLPSGLTLYLFISTLFSVIQQRIFMRDRAKVPAVVDVKAQRVH